MSKFRDRIRATAGRRGAPLGFGAPRTEAAVRYLVVAALADSAEAARAAAAAGADAIVYTGPIADAAAIVQAAGGAPVGVRIEAATDDDARALATAGADFLLFDADRTAATALLGNELGHVLLLPVDATEEYLKLLAPLDLDAVAVPEHVTAIPVREQLRVRRVADTAGKPLIVTVDGPVDARTLEVWRDAGGVILLTPAPLLAETLATAARVSAPRKRTPERAEPVLPTPPHDADDD